MTRIEKRIARIAEKLAILFEGREWQRYPNASQEKFQQLMMRRARELLKIADDASIVDDDWEKHR